MNSFVLINEDNEFWPPFAADIIFELWKELDEKSNKDTYFVRLFYCGEVYSYIIHNMHLEISIIEILICILNSNQKLMTITGKSRRCKLNDFIDIMKKHEISTQDHYNHLCSKTFIG